MDARLRDYFLHLAKVDSLYYLCRVIRASQEFCCDKERDFADFQRHLYPLNCQFSCGSDADDEFFNIFWEYCQFYLFF